MGIMPTRYTHIRPIRYDKFDTGQSSIVRVCQVHGLNPTPPTPFSNRNIHLSIRPSITYFPGATHCTSYRICLKSHLSIQPREAQAPSTDGARLPATGECSNSGSCMINHIRTVFLSPDLSPFPVHFSLHFARLLPSVFAVNAVIMQCKCNTTNAMMSLFAMP